MTLIPLYLVHVLVKYFAECPSICICLMFSHEQIEAESLKNTTEVLGAYAMKITYYLVELMCARFLHEICNYISTLKSLCFLMQGLPIGYSNYH